MEKPIQIIGRIDRIDMPEFGLSNIPAKIDTGANRSSIHCSEIEIKVIDGIDYLEFHIPLDTSHGINTFRTNKFFKKKIRSSSGHSEERYVITTTVVIMNRKIKTTFSLANRTEMNYPILLGRKALKSKFLVDVSQEDLSYKKKINENENSSTLKKS